VVLWVDWGLWAMKQFVTALFPGSALTHHRLAWRPTYVASMYGIYDIGNYQHAARYSRLGLAQAASSRWDQRAASDF